jgi:serine/threonine protein kinase
MGNGVFTPHTLAFTSLTPRRSEEKKSTSLNDEMVRHYPLTQISTAEEDEIHHRYVCESYLGHGSNAMVFLGKKRSDQTDVAIKRILISEAPGDVDLLINELNILKRINPHPNIVKLHCAYRHERCSYFVMDYLHGGDLRQLLRHHGVISQESIAYVIACIGSALNHIHRHRIIHRDVKLENIGFDSDGRPYLFDFGIAHVSASMDPEEPVICSDSSGTLRYLAPEVLTTSHRHSYQSDYWSLGVVAYELVYHHHPFVPHVPKSFISYVSNHYDFLTTSDDRLSTTEVITPEDGLVTLQFDRVIPLYLMHSFGLTRDLPPHVPHQNFSLELVKNEMIELLTGLLELRIPSRLGALQRFSQFTQQPLFHLFGYDDFKSLPSFISPLLVEASMSCLISIHPPRGTQIQIAQQAARHPLSADIEEILDKNFPYQSPPPGDHRVVSGNHPAQMNQQIQFERPLLSSLSAAEEMKLTTSPSPPPQSSV